jgi:hypothetical protein
MLGAEEVMRMLLLCLLLAMPLAANELAVGDDAPKFKAGGTIHNPPETARTLADCKGDVIVIMEWCIGDGKARLLPELQKRWEQHGEYGLMVFTVHRFDHNGLPEVRAFCRREKYTFPVAMGGQYDDSNEFGKYSGEKGFWSAIVDIDGKIAFFSRDSFIDALDKELARIEYPKLGKHVVAKEAERAAGKLKDRDFGEALVEAEKALEKELSEEARSDLELLQDRVNSMVDHRKKRIEEWTKEKRFDLVGNMHELQKEQFKRHKIGDEAKAELARLKKDKSVKKELEAFTALEKQIEKSEPQGTQMLINALRGFSNAHRGLGAADYAEQIIKERRAEIKD